MRQIAVVECPGKHRSNSVQRTFIFQLTLLAPHTARAHHNRGAHGECEPLWRPGSIIGRTSDGRRRSSGLREEAELGECRDAIVETDLLEDLAVLET